MLAELGLALLWTAATLSLLQLVSGALALTPRGADLAGLVRPVAVVQGRAAAGGAGRGAGAFAELVEKAPAAPSAL